MIWSSAHGTAVHSNMHLLVIRRIAVYGKKVYSYSGSGLSYFSVWEQGRWGDGKGWDLSIFIKALLLVQSLLNTELTLTGNWVLDKEHKQDIFLFFLEDNDSSLPLKEIVPELSSGREKCMNIMQQAELKWKAKCPRSQENLISMNYRKLLCFWMNCDKQ